MKSNAITCFLIVGKLLFLLLNLSITIQYLHLHHSGKLWPQHWTDHHHHHNDVVVSSPYPPVGLRVSSASLSVSSSVTPISPTGAAHWENDHDVVHVVLTRFMQRQPHLIHLGRARLELFRTFCLATMMQQSTKQFLWIIRTDPDLNELVKEELLRLVRSPEVMASGLHVLVVGSNERIDNGHFRTPQAVADIQPATVWAGDYQLFRDYFQRAQEKIVLETGLDADDGLALHFIQDMQRATANVAAAVAAKTSTTTPPSWWRIWCIQSVDEWQFFDTTTDAESTRDDDQYGAIDTETGVEKFCRTPGLTRVSTPDFHRYKNMSSQDINDDLIEKELSLDGTGFFVKHFFVKKQLPPCRDYNGIVETNPTPKLTKAIVTKCHMFFQTNYTQSIRARSPTSAGMKNIVVPTGKKKNETVKPPPVTNQSVSLPTTSTTTTSTNPEWERASIIFGLERDQIRESRSRILANLPRIVDDALSGQCTTGYSCKPSSATSLRRLKKNVQKRNNN